MSKQQKINDELTKTLTALIKDNVPLLSFINDNRKDIKHIFALTIDHATDDLLNYYLSLSDNIYLTKEYAQTLLKILDKKETKTEDATFSIAPLIANIKTIMHKNKKINDNGYVLSLLIELSYHSRDYKQYKYLEWAYEWLNYTKKYPAKKVLRMYFTILASLFLRNHKFLNYLNCVYRTYLLEKFSVDIEFIKRIGRILKYKSEKPSKYFCTLSVKSGDEIVEYFVNETNTMQVSNEKMKTEDCHEDEEGDISNKIESKNYQLEGSNVGTNDEINYTDKESEQKHNGFDNNHVNEKLNTNDMFAFDFKYYDMLEQGYAEKDIDFVSFLKLNNFGYEIEDDKLKNVVYKDKSLTTRIYEIIEDMKAKQKKNAAIIEPEKEKEKNSKVSAAPVVKKKVKTRKHKKKVNFFDVEYNLLRLYTKNIMRFIENQKDPFYASRVEKVSRAYNKERDEALFIRSLIERADYMEDMFKCLAIKKEKEDEEKYQRRGEAKEGGFVDGFRRGAKLGLASRDSQSQTSMYDSHKIRSSERNDGASLTNLDNRSGGFRNVLREDSYKSNEGGSFVRGQKLLESKVQSDTASIYKFLREGETHKRNDIDTKTTSFEIVTKDESANQEVKTFKRGSKRESLMSNEKTLFEQTQKTENYISGDLHGFSDAREGRYVTEPKEEIKSFKRGSKANTLQNDRTLYSSVVKSSTPQQNGDYENNMSTMPRKHDYNDKQVETNNFNNDRKIKTYMRGSKTFANSTNQVSSTTPDRRRDFDLGYQASRLTLNEGAGNLQHDETPKHVPLKRGSRPLKNGANIYSAINGLADNSSDRNNRFSNGFVRNREYQNNKTENICDSQKTANSEGEEKSKSEEATKRESVPGFKRGSRFGRQ